MVDQPNFACEVFRFSKAALKTFLKKSQIQIFLFDEEDSSIQLRELKYSVLQLA